MDGLDSTVRDRLRELPPSAKLVFYVLAQQQPLTQSAIVEETLLSKRTVRDALGRLESAGLVESELYIHDARRNLYSLTVSTSRD